MRRFAFALCVMAALSHTHPAAAQRSIAPAGSLNGPLPATPFSGTAAGRSLPSYSSPLLQYAGKLASFRPMLGLPKAAPAPSVVPSAFESLESVSGGLGRLSSNPAKELESRAVLSEAFDGKAPSGSGAGVVAAETPVLSRLPESRSWDIVDGGPIMGRHLDPDGVVYGGRRYIDFMNATGQRIAGLDGRVRDFLWVRAVRSGYKTEVHDDGSVGTSGYFSDTLLFELLPDGTLRFIERSLESDPEAGILLEDARVSSFLIRSRDPDTGRFRTEEHLYLGFTAHARHGGMEEPTSRNAFVRLHVGPDGVPRIERDEKGRPRLIYQSPPPLRLRVSDSDRYAVVDAKNSLLLTNARGEVRLHARQRYQAGDPRLPKGYEPAEYSEQSFPLTEEALAEGADWKPLLKKIRSHETARSDRLEEHYPERQLWPGSGKGLGPGAQPVRIQRRGDRLLISEGWGRPWIEAGRLSLDARAYLRNRRTYFLSFDHEIRMLGVAGRRKRVYTVSVKLWDQDLDRVLDYYADAVQPKEDYETRNPGIPDLWHVYPTGRILQDDGRLDTFEGAADANVVRRRWDLAGLLTEMAQRRGGSRPTGE